MPVVTDESKEYRVMLWLDDLESCRARLQSTVDAIERVNGLRDGLKAHRLDIPRTHNVDADAIGSMVVEREERLASLNAQACELTAALRGGARTIIEAWSANAGMNDGAFRYVVERYVRGRATHDAAKAAGLGKYEAKLAARRVAPMIYDSAPDVFGMDVGEVGYYGYAEAMAPGGLHARDGAGRPRVRDGGGAVWLRCGWCCTRSARCAEANNGGTCRQRQRCAPARTGRSCRAAKPWT